MASFKLSAAAWENFAAIERGFPRSHVKGAHVVPDNSSKSTACAGAGPNRRQSYEASLRSWSETLNNAGFQAFPLGIDYESEDFIDAHHFSNRGAPKMAADVAARVRRMAEKNGWTNQAMQ